MGVEKIALAICVKNLWLGYKSSEQPVQLLPVTTPVIRPQCIYDGSRATMSKAQGWYGNRHGLHIALVMGLGVRQCFTQELLGVCSPG